MTSPAGGPAPLHDPIDAVPVRHPGRWVAAAFIAVLIAMLVHSLAANPNWEWGVVGDYLFDHSVLHGVVLTLELTVLAMALGVVLGVLLAVMRLSTNPIVAGSAWLYVWFFRGTPLLVQIVFWYYMAALFPTISIGVPFGPHFASTSANNLIGKLTAAVLGLGLNEAAYMSEIARAGILAVDEGQRDAASALGMTRGQTMRRIVLPQAMRVIIPPTGNETISMLKNTALVSVIALAELFTTVNTIFARNYQEIPLLIVASIWYLAMTSVLYIGQYYLERHFARGSSRQLPLTPIQRIRMRGRRYAA
jgi:polar amino acid transport system permease protein